MFWPSGSWKKSMIFSKTRHLSIEACVNMKSLMRGTGSFRKYLPGLAQLGVQNTGMATPVFCFCIDTHGRVIDLGIPRLLRLICYRKYKSHRPRNA